MELPHPASQPHNIHPTREREEGESPNDHNDRMIRSVASYLQRQLALEEEASGVEVVMVTYDKANAARAKEEGVTVRSCMCIYTC